MCARDNGQRGEREQTSDCHASGVAHVVKEMAEAPLLQRQLVARFPSFRMLFPFAPDCSRAALCGYHSVGKQSASFLNEKWCRVTERAIFCETERATESSGFVRPRFRSTLCLSSVLPAADRFSFFIFVTFHVCVINCLLCRSTRRDEAMCAASRTWLASCCAAGQTRRPRIRASASSHTWRTAILAARVSLSWYVVLYSYSMYVVRFVLSAPPARGHRHRLFYSTLPSGYSSRCRLDSEYRSARTARHSVQYFVFVFACAPRVSIGRGVMGCIAALPVCIRLLHSSHSFIIHRISSRCITFFDRYPIIYASFSHCTV